MNGSYNIQRINELFGFTKINKVDVDMTIEHMMGWLNVILHKYSIGIAITMKSIRRMFVFSVEKHDVMDDLH